PGFRSDLGSPFLWILSFGEAKAKYLANGETVETISGRNTLLFLYKFTRKYPPLTLFFILT
ncbi:MAG: hypothetical protein K2W88_03050, partial [Pararheinheimera sp.]|nr:hypothetical protein [Rheinheimera sp.]